MDDALIDCTLQYQQLLGNSDSIVGSDVGSFVDQNLSVVTSRSFSLQPRLIRIELRLLNYSLQIGHGSSEAVLYAIMMPGREACSAIEL